MRPEFESFCKMSEETGIIVNNSMHMSVEQGLKVLSLIRDNISAGEPLVAIDSEQVGNKYTHCSWGLCSDKAQYYPDPNMHIWPELFVDEGLIAPLSMPQGHQCPMRDVGSDSEAYSQGTGCFYDCRVYQRSKPTPSATEAIELYREAIRKLMSDSSS